MKRWLTFLLFCAGIVGCVKEIPRPVSTQSLERDIVSVVNDTTLCAYWSNLWLVNGIALQVDSFRWYPDETNTDQFHTYEFNDTLAINYITFPDTGFVTLTNYLNGDSSSIAISILQCFQAVYIPGAFTPDDDGINDVWRPIFHAITDLDWTVSTESGEFVFGNEGNLVESWDGSWDENPAPAGLYRYHLEYITLENNQAEILEGWIQLHRN